jgi:hypothetical protein
VRLGAGSEQIAVNGRWAAVRDNTGATAFDLEARRRVARIKAATHPAHGATPVGISASGTLVYTDAKDRLWAGRRKLLEHVPQVVNVVGERAFVVQTLRGTPFTPLARMVGVDLGTGAVQPVTVALQGGWFTSDGARLLYSRGGCTFYGDVPATAPERTPVSDRCPREPLNFTAYERHRRPQVRMWASCPGGSAERCTGTARLRLKGRTLGRWRFSVAGGTRKTHVMKVRLPRSKRSLIARLRLTGSPTRPKSQRIVFLR